MKDFKPQSSKTQTKKAEQLILMVWDIKEIFYLMVNNMKEVTTEKEM